MTRQDKKYLVMMGVGLGLALWASRAGAAPARKKPTTPAPDAGEGWGKIWDWMSKLRPEPKPAPPKSVVEMGRYMLANGKCWDIEDKQYVADDFCDDLRGYR